jgi:hypothetical protein
MVDEKFILTLLWTLFDISVKITDINEKNEVLKIAHLDWLRIGILSAIDMLN